MKKQSSIEWLVEQMKQRENQGLTLSMYELEMFADQAKEMHKQEIIEAKDCWFEDESDGEQYYKNTYEKELTKQPIKNPIEIGCYICRIDDAYIKMCYWNDTEWLDMWKPTLEGIVNNWIKIPINL